MTVITLDSIVKNILLKRGYSYHWYIDFLVYAKDGMRELSFDLPIHAIQYKVLAVNQTAGDEGYSTAELPNDYQDYCRVSAWLDQYLRPLVEDNNLQLMTNYDADWATQPYAEGIATEPNQSVTFYTGGYLAPWWWTTFWNSYGENTGRFFGGVGTYPDTFRIDKTKNRIKINENLFCENILLEYISNGMNVDSATHIDSYAQAAIEAYCLWQFYLHNRTYTQREAEVMFGHFAKQKDVLQARLSDLTMDNFKRIVQRNNIGIKY